MERERQIELQKQAQKQVEEEEARERRLEELRATVAITAERDVARTYGETESSKAAAAAGAQVRDTDDSSTSFLVNLRTLMGCTDPFRRGLVHPIRALLVQKQATPFMLTFALPDDSS